MNKLKNLQKSTSKSTSREELVERMNTGFSELEEILSTNLATNEQQTSNQQITNKQPHRKNVKNNKNVKNIKNSGSAAFNVDGFAKFLADENGGAE